MLAFPKTALSYLSVSGASVIYLRIGATARLTQSLVGAAWCAWVHGIDDAKRIVAGIRPEGDVAQLAAQIEQRARVAGIPLTAHETAIARASERAQRVDKVPQ